MKTCLITGVAGFIGFHTAHLLLENNIRVIGVDALTPYYDPAIKKKNIQDLRKFDLFTFHEENLLSMDFSSLDQSIHYLIHLAASPGVRFSDQREKEYIDNNIKATEVLLDWAKDQSFEKIIIASTSSIYDDRNALPYSESSALLPKALYGKSKLRMEKFCLDLKEKYNLPLVLLRYFSAYGPRQRPDMALHIFMKKLTAKEKIEIYGDGLQSRDFTFVKDVAQANFLALHQNNLPNIINIASGSRITVNDLIEKLFSITGLQTQVIYTPKLNEESNHTEGDITLAKEKLNYSPSYSIDEGILLQWKWIKTNLI